MGWFLASIPNKLLKDSGFSKLIQLKYQYNQAQLDNWIHDDLHKWTWWLNLVAVIVPILILRKIIDRKRLLEILVFGFLVALFATFLDAIGTSLMLWDYPDRFLPISPRLLPVDFIAIPFIFMLIYQYCLSWLKFLIIDIIVAFIFSFVLEPLLVWLNLYIMLNWHYYWSFPIYIAIPILVRLITTKIVSQDLNYKKPD